MFRENKAHLQNNLFNSLSGMDKRFKEKLETSWAGLFYKHVFSQIDEQLFAPLYSSDNGRPNFPVNIFAGLDIIKHLKGYVDEVLFEEYAYNYQISFALGLRSIGERYFAPRTFYDYRARLYNYTLDHPQESDIIFQEFEELTWHFIEMAHLNTDEQRMDSSQIMSNIKRAGRLALAYDVLLQGIKACPPEILSPALKEFLEPNFKTKLLYKVKDSETSSRLENILNLDAELIQLVNVDPELKNQPKIQLLERFLKEQADFDDKRKVWLAKEDKAIAARSLQSAYDAEATYRKKAGKDHVGYVVNLAETCAEDNPVQIITHYQLEPNSTSDIEMIQKNLPELKETTDVKELYLDGGYYSSEVVKQAETLDVNLHYTDMTGRTVTSGKLPYNAFSISHYEKILACPEGQGPVRSHINPKNGILSAHFDLNICSQCLVKEQCPVKVQKKDTVLYVSQKALIAENTRLTIQNGEERRESGSKRAAVEGTNSALKRARGAGKLKVRGIVRCSLVMGLKTIAHNFHQIVRFIQGDTRQKVLRRRVRVAVSI